MADVIYSRYLTTEAYDRALVGGEYTQEAFTCENSRIAVSRQNQTSTEEYDEPFRGDQTLANSILRMRDSMMHYEFQSTIADGDIGR